MKISIERLKLISFLCIISFSCNSNDDVNGLNEFIEIRGRVIFYYDGIETGIPSALIDLTEYGVAAISEKDGTYIIRIAEKNINPDNDLYGPQLVCSIEDPSLFDDLKKEDDGLIPLVDRYSGLAIFSGIKDEYNFYYTSSENFEIESDKDTIIPGEKFTLKWSDLNPEGILGYRIKMQVGTRDARTLISFVPNNNTVISYEKIIETMISTAFPANYKLWVELLEGNGKYGPSAALANSDTIIVSLEE